jgi:hypothetical protein
VPDELQLLRQKVDSLTDEVRDIRTRLLNCLDVAPRRPKDALGLARGIAETLAKQTLAALGTEPPPMLDACLRELRKPETMSRALVPAEIITMLDKVRTIGNKALHDALSIEVALDDVTSVLGDVLRVTRWYFGEFDRGPRLDPVLGTPRPPPAPPVSARNSSVLKAVQAIRSGTKVLYPALADSTRAGQNYGEAEILNSTLHRIEPMLRLLAEQGIIKYHLATSDVSVETVNKVCFQILDTGRLEDIIHRSESGKG